MQYRANKGATVSGKWNDKPTKTVTPENEQKLTLLPLVPNRFRLKQVNVIVNGTIQPKV